MKRPARAAVAEEPAGPAKSAQKSAATPDLSNAQRHQQSAEGIGHLIRTALIWGVWVGTGFPFSLVRRDGAKRRSREQSAEARKRTSPLFRRPEMRLGLPSHSQTGAPPQRSVLLR